MNDPSQFEPNEEKKTATPLNGSLKDVRYSYLKALTCEGWAIWIYTTIIYHLFLCFDIYIYIDYNCPEIKSHITSYIYIFSSFCRKKNKNKEVCMQLLSNKGQTLLKTQSIKAIFGR